jgi:hypothetical protein
MRLVRVLSPDTEAELNATVEMLEAFEIPCFVCNAGRDGPSLGARRQLSKPQSVMVPAERVAEAIELIGDHQDSRAPHGDLARNPWLIKLRALVRLVCLGWLARVLDERGFESRPDPVAQDRSPS